MKTFLKIIIFIALLLHFNITKAFEKDAITMDGMPNTGSVPNISGLDTLSKYFFYIGKNIPFVRNVHSNEIEWGGYYCFDKTVMIGIAYHSSSLDPIAFPGDFNDHIMYNGLTMNPISNYTNNTNSTINQFVVSIGYMWKWIGFGIGFTKSSYYKSWENYYTLNNGKNYLHYFETCSSYQSFPGVSLSMFIMPPLLQKYRWGIRLEGNFSGTNAPYCYANGFSVGVILSPEAFLSTLLTFMSQSSPKNKQ